MKPIAFLLAVLISAGSLPADAQSQYVLLTHATLIKGTGAAPQNNMDVLVKGSVIASVQSGMTNVPDNTRVVDLQGKTIMPALICAHAHIGGLKGNAVAAENYTRENILRQLNQYEDYGIGTVLSLGTDKQVLLDLRDSSENGLLPGARVYSAGYGIGVPTGGPPVAKGVGDILRPATAAEAVADVMEIAKLKPEIVKIWVDDFNGKFPKMTPEVYQAVIREAHRQHLRVAAHVYYLEDARKLVHEGIDVLAHSVRSADIDDALVKEMKLKGTTYIPTLSLDEFAFIYARQPQWLNDTLFRKSLEPGVYEMITSEEYRKKLENDPLFKVNEAAFATSLRNLKKLFDGGVFICFGTDSGATPIRAQGFSEHLELELMVQAGLTPLQAITVATGNSAKLLRLEKSLGTLQVGKKADFLVLSGNPALDITQTRNIESVWKDGKEVSKGPLAK